MPGTRLSSGRSAATNASGAGNLAWAARGGTAAHHRFGARCHDVEGWVGLLILDLEHEP